MPALSHERLARDLREGKRGGVFFLHGDESYLKDGLVRELVSAHLDPATRDFNLDQVRGGEVGPDTLASLIQTPPMMAEWRVVVVRDAEALASSASARSVLEAALDATPPGLALVLLADVAGSKAKLWARLKKEAVSVELARLPESDVPGWLMARTETDGVTLEAEAARALAVAVGPDLAMLTREIEKLRELAGDRGTITAADVARAVGAVPRQDRWAWFDLVAGREFQRARAGLAVLLDTGETGVGLVIGLGTHFLRLALCRAGGRAALEAELPPHQRWLARRIEAQARRWTDAALRGALDDLRRADRLLKSAPLSDHQVMEELLLRLRHGAEAAA